MDNLELLRAECMCTTCLRIFVQATTVNPCGHVFCWECYEGALDHIQNGALRCSICRVPAEGPVRNLYLDNMIRLMVANGTFAEDDAEVYLERVAGDPPPVVEEVAVVAAAEQEMVVVPPHHPVVVNVAMAEVEVVVIDDDSDDDDDDDASAIEAERRLQRDEYVRVHFGFTEDQIQRTFYPQDEKEDEESLLSGIEDSETEEWKEEWEE